MVCHADTVFESDTGFLRFELLDAVAARGPGVIDDKGSMVVLLLALEKYFERTEKPVSIRVICTPTEELGSPGFSKILEKIGDSSRFALGFEPALADGSVVHSRQGNLWYRIQVTGKEGHAGRAYRESVNAAHELCLKLMELQKLPGKSPLPTVNIGTIRAGEGKYNVVCGRAEGFVDIRVADRKQLEQVEKGVAKIFKKTFT
jgi:glutamate carboxypeptidase